MTNIIFYFELKELYTYIRFCLLCVVSVCGTVPEFKIFTKAINQRFGKSTKSHPSSLNCMWNSIAAVSVLTLAFSALVAVFVDVGTLPFVAARGQEISDRLDFTALYLTSTPAIMPSWKCWKAGADLEVGRCRRLSLFSLVSRSVYPWRKVFC